MFYIASTKAILKQLKRWGGGGGGGEKGGGGGKKIKLSPIFRTPFITINPLLIESVIVNKS